MAYDIFISYKRKDANSRNTAPYIYDMLLHKGYNVFFDRKEMRSGKFDEQLLNHLDNATDIIILLGPDSLKSWFDYKDDERYKPRDDDEMGATQEPPYKTDWFCREVMHALSLEGKNIIPLLLDGYKMPDAKDLPPELKALQLHNAIEVDICEIEDMYQKYFLGMEYLKSTPKNLALQRQYRNGGSCVGQFLFYTDAASCELYECGEKIITLTDDNDRHHPFCRTVNFAGEHLFRLFNNDTCEEIEIEAVVETNSQKYVSVEWTLTQNLWELTDEDITGQTDGDTLFFWGKWLFDGTEKNAPDIGRSVQCFQRACDMGNESAINFMKSHGDADLDSKNAPDEIQFKWYKLSAEMGSIEGQTGLAVCYNKGQGVEKDEIKAFELFSTSADTGNARAQRNLGVCYANGYGVEQDYAKAVEWYTKAAEQGDARAQFSLGWMYANGEGVEQDYAKAVEWYTKSVEQGYFGAQVNLGGLYKKGLGVKQDYIKAVELFTKAAEQGNGRGQCALGMMYYFGYGVEQDYNKAKELYTKAVENGDNVDSVLLGVMYENGYGVEQDYAKAVELYTRSAELGNAQGQLQLGYMYENGYGVEQDYTKAFEWYTMAAEQEEPKAYFSLGHLYYYGLGRERDYGQAFMWWSKGAEQGDAADQFFVGHMYENGEGVEQDFVKAVEWYTKSAEQGHVEGQKSLAHKYYCGLGVEQDYNQAFKWYSKAAEKGDDAAQFSLGVHYYNGKGVNQDYAKAFEWWSKAAEQGNASAQGNLGFMYTNGVGVEQDYVKAVEWFTKAAEQGHAGAQFNLARMYANGDGVEQNYGKAVEWYTKSAEQDFVPAYNGLAWTYHLMGEYEKALPWALKAIENEPDDSNVIDTLATVYKGLGRYEEAIEQFELCLQLLEAGENNDEQITEIKAKIEEVKSLMGEA